jgi:hypothetical protein
VHVRLIEIGEAVKSIDLGLLTDELDHLAHRYFDTAHSIVAATITYDCRP